MLILSSIPGSLECGSVNQTLIYQNPELKVFKNITSLGEISLNCPNDLLGTRTIDS